MKTDGKYSLVTSSVHRWDDTRIYHRQIFSLKKHWPVMYIATDDQRLSSRIRPGIFVQRRRLSAFLRIKNIVMLLIYILRHRENIQTWHFHDPELLLLTPFVKIIANIPIIFDVHEDVRQQIMYKRWLPKWAKSFVKTTYDKLELKCFPYLAAIIYTTEEVKKNYTAFPRKLVSIQNYPANNSVLALPERAEELALIYLGVMTPIRGGVNLIKSMVQVCEKFPRGKLLIIGNIKPDSYKIELQKLIIKLHLHDNIKLLGHMKYKKALTVAQRGTAGILPFLPTQNHFNSLPNKLFEYMSLGLPVLASDFPIYRAIIEKADCGLVFNPEDTNCIANSIISIYHMDENKFTNMRINSQYNFDKYYNWRTEEHKLLALYAEIIEDS